MERVTAREAAQGGERVMPGALMHGCARIGAFLALVALLTLLLQWAIDRGLRRIDTGDFGVWNRIVSGAINADIVISGSSRALTHYDARVIAAATGLSAYNIGLNGSQTDMQVARLKTYLRHNRKPRLVIYNLDIFSFQTTHGGVYDPGQYVPYLAEPELYDALSAINPAVWKSRFVPLHGYAVEDGRLTWMRGLLRLAGKNPTEDRFLGFKPQHTTWTEDFERFRAANPKGVRFAVEPMGVAAMEDLLETCLRHGIKVLLIYSPEFAGSQRLTLDRSQTMAQFESLARRHGAAMWDYSGSPISDRQQNFYNSQHLNADGADAFSKHIAARLAAGAMLATIKTEAAGLSSGTEP